MDDTGKKLTEVNWVKIAPFSSLLVEVMFFLLGFQIYSLWISNLTPIIEPSKVIRMLIDSNVFMFTALGFVVRYIIELRMRVTKLEKKLSDRSSP